MHYNHDAYGLITVDLFEDITCQRIVERANNVNRWQRAAVVRPGSQGDFHEIVDENSRAGVILSLHDAPEVFSEFCASLTTHIRPIIGDVWHVDAAESYGTHLVRYPTGGYFRAHRDTGFGVGNRLFTVICYLNDDFEGGATSFPNLDQKIIPKCGRFLVFPSDYLHGSDTVTGGEKYIFVTWIVQPQR